MNFNESGRKKLFNKFLSGGFSDLNLNDPQDAHHFQFYKKNFLHKLPEDKNAVILEIGFGMGQFMRFLKDAGYKNVYGTEVSEEMFEYNTEKFKAKNIELIEDIEKFLENKKNEYDVVVMNDVIEHFEKARVIPILEAIKKSLHVNGRLIIKTNNVAAITGTRMRHEDFTHESSFTPYSLRQVLKVAGYDCAHIYPYRVPITNPLRAIRVFFQDLQHLIWKFVYWVEYTTVPPVVHEFMIGMGCKKK